MPYPFSDKDIGNTPWAYLRMPGFITALAPPRERWVASTEKLGDERNAFHHLVGDMAIRHGDDKRDCPDDLIAKNGYPVSLTDVGKPIAEACCIAESSMLVNPDRRRGNAIKAR